MIAKQKPRRKLSLPALYLLTWLGSTAIGCLTQYCFLRTLSAQRIGFYLLITFAMTAAAAIIETIKGRHRGR